MPLEIKLASFSLEPICVAIPNHKEAYLKLLSDEEINQKMFSVDYFLGDINDALGKTFENDYFIRYNDTFIGLFEIEPFPGGISISYALFEEIRGKGLMTKLLKEFYCYACQCYPDDFRLSLYIKAKNHDSCKVAKHAEFQFYNADYKGTERELKQYMKRVRNRT